MNRNHVRKFATILNKHGIHYVIVGGAAVAEVYPSESRDVDVLLMTREYARGVDALDHDPSIVSMSRDDSEMAGGHFVVGHEVVRFDVLDPSAFSGRRPGDTFFDYVARFGSRGTADGRVAKVGVVWYTRLVIESDAWLVQVQKILRDLRAGAPWALTKDVHRIARRFGVQTRIMDRLEFLQQEAERAGLRPSQ
ncbi:MAG TPA: hypothetical protein VGX00_02020 [Thermoplasmata archaeon]|nr:hypothetical protein [Thermoplasmata archaeon]